MQQRVLIMMVGVLFALAACAPAPQVIVQAPTQTLPGPVVPTRIPTDAPTATPIPPTATPIPPTATPVPPTATPIPPTATPVPPTATPIPPTATPIPPTATPVPPTATPVPPTATSVPPTATSVPPTATPVPPTATPVQVSAGSTGRQYLNGTGLRRLTLGENLNVGGILSGALSYAQPVMLFPLAAQAGDVVTLMMERVAGGDLNFFPRLIVIDPKGREIARTSDVSSSAVAEMRGLTLPDAGTYVVAAGSTYSVATGVFTLTAASGAADAPAGIVASAPLQAGTAQTGEISDAAPYAVYTFSGRAGDRISLRLEADASPLDPRLILQDNLGQTLALNEDDYTVNGVNSLIAGYTLATSGTYSVLATRFPASEPTVGGYRLLLSVDAPAEGGPLTVLEGALNPFNSLSLREDFYPYWLFVAGDDVDADKNEMPVESFLTFTLPELPAGFDIRSATLQLAPCLEFSSGFAVLGALEVRSERYGLQIDLQGFPPPGAGAQVLATQPSCDPGVDVREVVLQAYADGMYEIQFRLAFPYAMPTGQGDLVSFTPRLILRSDG